MAHLISCVSFEVFTVVTIPVVVIWVMTLCSLVGKYQYFSGTDCMHLFNCFCCNVCIYELHFEELTVCPEWHGRAQNYWKTCTVQHLLSERQQTFESQFACCSCKQWLQVVMVIGRNVQIKVRLGIKDLRLYQEVVGVSQGAHLLHLQSAKFLKVSMV